MKETRKRERNQNNVRALTYSTGVNKPILEGETVISFEEIICQRMKEGMKEEQESAFTNQYCSWTKVSFKEKKEKLIEYLLVIKEKELWIIKN